MNRIFGRYLEKLVLVYLDDILVFSKNQKEHLEHFDKVFDILHKNMLYAKLTKCYYAKEEVEYLGHVGKDGIKVDPRKIETMAKWVRPKDVSQLHSIFGSL
jgi:TFIIF-interacting CTD phosphatase-like protein